MEELTLDILPIKSKFDSNAHVAVITLRRERRGNSLTPQLCRKLVEALETVSKDSHTRALVLTGSGKFFCTGMDMQQASTSDRDSDGIKLFQGMFDLLSNFPLPTLCVMNGPAMGGGVGLMACCDIRIAINKNDYVALTELYRGLIPALISPYILNAFGNSLSMQLSLTGARMSMSELFSSGIIDCISDGSPPKLQLPTGITQRIFPQTQYLDEYLRVICMGGPNASKKIKKLFKSLSLTADKSGQQALVTEAFKQMMSSEEAVFGMSAFLQKQQVNWAKL